MINWFTKGRDTAKAEPIVEKVDLKNKSMNDIVLEIHHSFNTEVENLLKLANIKIETPTIDNSLTNKAENLKKLGFKSCKTVSVTAKKLQEVNLVEQENEARSLLIETIQYFQMHYPNYKFITEESVKKICTKYNLIYGDVDNYIGDVPEKNIQDMLNFKIKEEDCCFTVIEGRFGRLEKYINYTDFLRLETLIKKEQEERKRSLLEGEWLSYRFGGIISADVKKSPFVIAAPLKDFDTKNMVLEGTQLKNKIEIPDPVVLQPVMYKKKRYFLVVTAWGLEASDELVVNQKMN